MSEKGIKEKVFIFLKSVVSLIIVFGVLGWINEFYTKPILKLQRPSHVYMLKQTNIPEKIDELYTLTKKERGQFFAELIKIIQKHLKTLILKFKTIGLKKQVSRFLADIHLMRSYLQW